MHPLLYEIPTPWGPLPIYTHGLALAVVALVGWYWLVRGEEQRERAALFVSAWIAGLVVGKVEWAAIHQSSLAEGGISLPGFMAGTVFIVWVRGAPSRVWKPAVPILMLTAAAHAMGQWLHGAAFGRRFDGPALLEQLGTYPRWPSQTGSPAWLAHRDLAWADADLAASFPTHPLTLYEAVTALVLTVLATKRPQLSALAVAMLAALHLALEPLRAESGLAAYFTPIAVVAIAGVAWWRERSAGSEPA